MDVATKQMLAGFVGAGIIYLIAYLKYMKS